MKHADDSSTDQAAGSGAQSLNLFNVNVDDGIAVRLSLGDSHNVDAAFQCFATNNNLNYLTRSRQVALVKICPRLVFSALKANMTNVMGHVNALDKAAQHGGQASQQGGPEQ